MATVLIVEDQAQILTLAQSLLEEEGYKTLTAPSAEDALVILAGPEPVDALFVDIILNQDMHAGPNCLSLIMGLRRGEFG
jgi:CheY-like chemotaxis protein